MVTHTLFLSNIHSKRIFTRALSGIRAGILKFQMLAVANSHSFGPFGLVLDSEEACVDLDASLNKASKFAVFIHKSYSNVIGLLIHVLRQPNGDLLVIGPM